MRSDRFEVNHPNLIFAGVAEQIKLVLAEELVKIGKIGDRPLFNTSSLVRSKHVQTNSLWLGTAQFRAESTAACNLIAG